MQFECGKDGTLSWGITLPGRRFLRLDPFPGGRPEPRHVIALSSQFPARWCAHFLRKCWAKPEAYCNTIEGIGTGVRMLLAHFRGVSKWYQAQYAAVFEWDNTEGITGDFVQGLIGLRVASNPGT